MKKIFKINILLKTLILILPLVMLLSMLPPINASVALGLDESENSSTEINNITPEFDEFLRTPSLVAPLTANNKNYLIVYDSEIEVIKAYNLSEKTPSNIPCSYLKATVYSMTSNSNSVYALVKTSINLKKLVKLTINSDNNIESSDVVIPAEYNITVNNVTNIYSFIMLSNEFLILNQTNTLCLYNVTQQEKITVNFESGNDIQGEIKKIVARDSYNLFVMQEDKVLKLTYNSNDNNYTKASFYTPPENESISDLEIVHTITGDVVYIKHGKTISKYDTQNNPILNLNSSNTSNFTNMTGYNNSVLLSDPLNHRVVQYANAITTVIENRQFSPTLSESETSFIVKPNTTTYLQQLPYTYADATLLDETDYLVVISTDSTFFEHYFCLYAMHNENRYGFVKREDVTLLENYTNQEDLYTFSNETYVYTYPSTTIDSRNELKTILPSGARLTNIKSLGEYKTKDGNTFSIVKVNDEIMGYVETKHLTNIKVASSSKIKNNAKVYDDTNLYINSDGTGTILTIPKNTRVRAEEKIDRNNKFTKITYTTSSGEKISGYVETNMLVSDSLTTLQILGIIFIALNLAVMATIIIIRLKFKKRAVK